MDLNLSQHKNKNKNIVEMFPMNLNKIMVHVLLCSGLLAGNAQLSDAVYPKDYNRSYLNIAQLG